MVRSTRGHRRSRAWRRERRGAGQAPSSANGSTGSRQAQSGCYARPMDLDLSPEHTLLRDTIRDFMLTEVAPIIDEHERDRRFPSEIVRPHRRARLARHPDPRGRGRRRSRHPRLRHRRRGDRPGVGFARPHRGGPYEPRLRAAPPGRHARAAAALPGPDGRRGGHRRVRPDRTERRERFGRDTDDGAARGRSRRRLVGARRRPSGSSPTRARRGRTW